jgi:hypothetical protein
VVIIVKVGLENMIDVRNRYILLLNVDKCVVHVVFKNNAHTSADEVGVVDDSDGSSMQKCK